MEIIWTISSYKFLFPFSQRDRKFEKEIDCKEVRFEKAVLVGLEVSERHQAGR